MDDISDYIDKILLGIGIEESIREIITGILAALGLVIIISRSFSRSFRSFISWLRKKKMENDLSPFYTLYDIQVATKFYIKTKYKIPSPEDEKDDKKDKTNAKQLIPYFIKKAFKNDDKFFLVLADSGMGKTTFMINLYLAYKSKIEWFWQSQKYQIILFPLDDPNTLATIAAIPDEDKKNTILLLDAFDEDLNNTTSNYKIRLQELVEKVWMFRKIVITCRTQFFPTADDEPRETGIFTHGTDQKEYVFQKMIIPVFSGKDVRHYLRKKFKPFFLLWNIRKYIEAQEMIIQCPDIMMCPMLLKYIDDLLKINKNQKIIFRFQIYEFLVQQWLERESTKSYIIKKYDKDQYQNFLLRFSKALMAELYLKKKLSLSISEIKEIKLKKTKNKSIEIEIEQLDKSRRSLLIRNAAGEYEFAHKSILEYFIASEIIYNKKFRQKFKFTNKWDTAHLFHIEMIIMNKINDKDILKMQYGDYNSEEYIKLYKSMRVYEYESKSLSFYKLFIKYLIIALLADMSFHIFVINIIGGFLSWLISFEVGLFVWYIAYRLYGYEIYKKRKKYNESYVEYVWHEQYESEIKK
jgi:hypothetical protein